MPALRGIFGEGAAGGKAGCFRCQAGNSGYKAPGIKENICVAAKNFTYKFYAGKYDKSETIDMRGVNSPDGELDEARHNKLKSAYMKAFNVKDLPSEVMEKIKWF